METVKMSGYSMMTTKREKIYAENKVLLKSENLDIIGDKLIEC